MIVSKSMPIFSVLFKVTSNLNCFKMLGLRFITSTCRNISIDVNYSFHKSIEQRSFLNVYYLLNTITYTNCSSRLLSGAGLRGETKQEPMSKPQANELVLRLTEEERKHLLTALQEFEANKIKTEYEGQLAAARWRSRFGRPSKLPTLGDVDPTGTYCQLSDDWLKKKYAKLKYNTKVKDNYWDHLSSDSENVPPPTLHQLMNVAVHNAIPFVGFGFLDNAIMIIAGDYIELTMGTFITISTMAAAALGNTISDVMGIGSAWYVELLASRVGLKPPNLSPVQLDMKSARRFANLGRALGITVGCLLGMLPLLFIKSQENEKDTSDAPTM